MEVHVRTHLFVFQSQDKRKWGTLHVAAKYDRQEIASLLIARGADVTARSDRNALPLHVASMEGHVAMMRILLEACVERERVEMVNCVTVEDESPLDAAVERRKIDAVRLCLQHGSNLKQKHRNQTIILTFAISLLCHRCTRP